MAGENRQISKAPKPDLRFVRMAFYAVGLTWVASACLLIMVTVFAVFCVPSSRWPLIQPLQSVLIQILKDLTTAVTTGAMALLVHSVFGGPSSAAVRRIAAALSRENGFDAE
jgi:hypothetical protein